MLVKYLRLEVNRNSLLTAGLVLFFVFTAVWANAQSKGDGTNGDSQSTFNDFVPQKIYYKPPFKWGFKDSGINIFSSDSLNSTISLSITNRPYQDVYGDVLANGVQMLGDTNPGDSISEMSYHGHGDKVAMVESKLTDAKTKAPVIVGRYLIPYDDVTILLISTMPEKYWKSFRPLLYRSFLSLALANKDHK